MFTRRRLRCRGLTVDSNSRIPCPFLSAFADMYVPCSRPGISTKDLHMEYKHFVSSRTSDVRLMRISENFARFSIQFSVVAVHRKFVKNSSGYKGYLVQRVGRNVHRADNYSQPIFGRPLDYDLRNYSTRSSILNRRSKEDQTSGPVIAPVSDDIGNGVFASHDYVAGQEVCECLGQMVSKEEAEIRQVEYDRLGLSYRLINFEAGYGSSLCCFDCHRNVEGNRIDPDSNLGGNINHSCNPNCKLVKKVRGGRTRFFLETITAVCEVAEFLMNYGVNRPGLHPL